MTQRDKCCGTCLNLDEDRCHLEPLAEPKRVDDWCSRGWEENTGWYAASWTRIFGIWQMTPFRPWFLREEDARTWTNQWNWPDYVTAVWSFGGGDCPTPSELAAAKRKELGIEVRPKQRGLLARVFG